MRTRLTEPDEQHLTSGQPARDLLVPGAATVSNDGMNASEQPSSPGGRDLCRGLPLVGMVLAIMWMQVGVACRALPREQVPEGVSASRIEALETRDGGLALRRRKAGRDEFGLARLPERAAEQVAVVEIGHEARDSWLAARRARGHVLPVLPSSVWQETMRRLAARLIPAGKRDGVLVSAGSREVLAARGVDGEAAFFPPGQFPEGVRVTGHRSLESVLPEAMAILTTLRPERGNGHSFLVATGAAPPLAWVQPARRRVLFLAEPADSSLTTRLGQSGRLAVGGLASVGLRSGVAAALKNPATSALRMAGNVLSFGQTLTSRVTAPWPGGPPPPVMRHRPMDPAGWESRLDALGAAAPLPAAVRFHIDGDSFFPVFLGAVQAARRSIDLQVYIFDNDPYAVQVGELLRRRADDVRVRVLMDELASLQAGAADPQVAVAGSQDGPAHVGAWLRNGSKVRVREMAMTGLCASHSKLVIIDGERGFTGGMNIGREYRSEWHDMMIELEGPLVQAMSDEFAWTWAHAGWAGDAAALWTAMRRRSAPAIPVPRGSIPVRPLPGGPLRSPLFRAQMAAMESAQQRIWVQNAYLSDPRVLRALVAARHRGVDVRVVLCEENDNKLMAANNRVIVPALLARGVRVWMLPGMSHVKAALYDGWACVGSANFDRLSADVNDEWNIGFSAKSAVRELEERLFLRDFKEARELHEAPDATPADKVSDQLMHVLAGQL